MARLPKTKHSVSQSKTSSSSFLASILNKYQDNISVSVWGEQTTTTKNKLASSNKTCQKLLVKNVLN